MTLKIAIKVAYFSNIKGQPEYHGWQIQPEVRSIFELIRLGLERTKLFTENDIPIEDGAQVFVLDIDSLAADELNSTPPPSSTSSSVSSSSIFAC